MTDEFMEKAWVIARQVRSYNTYKHDFDLADIEATRTIAAALRAAVEEEREANRHEHEASMTEIANLRTEIERLTRELEEAMPRDQWQPIESAPKDGTRIWLYWPDYCYTTDDSDGPYVGTGQWKTNHRINKSYFSAFPDESDDYGSSLPAHAPTHWQPLPPPPAAQAKGEEG